MKKLLICLISLPAFGYSGSAQSIEAGLTYQHVSYTGAVLKTFNPGTGQSPVTHAEDMEGSTGLFGIDIAYYHPFYKMANDNFSVGVQAVLRPCIWVEGTDDAKNASGQTVASGSSGGNFALHIPVFANARWGGFASEDSDLEYGMGLGVGAMYHTFEYGLVAGDKGSQFSPVLKLEAFVKGVVFNVCFVLNSYESKYQSTFGEIPKIEYNSLLFGINIQLNGD